MTHVIAVVNGKGGAGKSSIAANLAGLWAAAGARVLLADVDPQANQSEELGFVATDRDDDGAEFTRALLQGDTPKPTPNVRVGLDVLVGGSQIHQFRKSVIVNESQNGEWTESGRLAESLAGLVSDYDYIFIDAPPGYPELQANILAFATQLLLPLQQDLSSRKGLRNIADIMSQLGESGFDTPELLGAVIFDANSRSQNTTIADVRQALVDDLGDNSDIFTSFIRAAKSVAIEARSRGLLIHELEVDAAEMEPEIKKNRFKALAAGKRPTVRQTSAAVTGLAADYSNLAHEINTKLEGKGNA